MTRKAKAAASEEIAKWSEGGQHAKLIGWQDTQRHCLAHVTLAGKTFCIGFSHGKSDEALVKHIVRSRIRQELRKGADA